MTKLSDSQRGILSAAAQHEMGLARAPKTLPAAARNAVFRSLIKNNLLTEINAPRDFVGLGWRQDEDGTWIVARITDEGLRAIGNDPNEGDAGAGEPDCSGIEGSVPHTAPTVAPAAEPATQDAKVAEAAHLAGREGGGLTPSERRWIILAQNGRHVTMGRAAPPSEAEVEAAAAALAAQGLAGWLATLDGNYWSRRRVALAPVQTLRDGAALDWPAAITAFEAARQRALRPL